MKKIVGLSISICIIIIIGMLFMTGNEKDTEITKHRTKVGFIYNGSIDDKGWGQSHYEGIQRTAQKLNLEIIYEENVPFDETCMNMIQDMIRSGCEIIICNSFDYGEWVVKAAEQNPEIIFFHATGVEEGSNICTYFGRMYQMRYLSGVVAGLQSETNEIGYVAAFPIDEVNRGINAFTLGVQSVNPDATVHVAFTESWTDDTINAVASQKLIDEFEIDVLTMHCDTTAPLAVAEENEIWSIGYNMDNSTDYPNSFLTAAIWDWEAFYTPQITECLQGKFQPKHCWDGAETDLVDLSPYTSNVKDGTKEKVDDIFKELNNGTFDVFYGPVWDNHNVLRIGEGENMPDDALLNSFDWYVKGVEIYE